ncbi:hypothetical protein [Govanella unica]|uniref:Uncharacterized protein n=1 Tax=Govanella unica TaxID=2975056 RepID=A0A9X3Z7R8_9PROT|nr:hypothetical protein [Govania unica]MDA5194520.1 hypothetical protein [Govania unica]
MSKKITSPSNPDQRQARLGAALRANLRRRKDQARAQTRATASDTADKSSGDDAAPLVKDQ